MIDSPLGTIDYDERGHGPTLVLVPGSCSTGAAWRPVIAEWHDRYRCVTTSLLGYGRTAERRTLTTADMAHEADMLEAVVRRAAATVDGPVHLIGHSFGGTTALAVALRGRVPVASLTVIEPPIPELLRHMGEHGHYAAFRDMTDAYFSAFNDGNSRAIGTMIDFYGGAGTFAGWPEKVCDYAVATTAVNLLDWICAYSFHLTQACLAKVEVPTLVIRGRASHPAMKRATQLLAQCLGDSRLATIEGKPRCCRGCGNRATCCIAACKDLGTFCAFDRRDRRIDPPNVTKSSVPALFGDSGLQS
jgi:pimeloyl-ACP methyl ester carboxylesterase